MGEGRSEREKLIGCTDIVHPQKVVGTTANDPSVIKTTDGCAHVILFLKFHLSTCKFHVKWVMVIEVKKTSFSDKSKL